METTNPQNLGHNPSLQPQSQRALLAAALQWHLDAGCDTPLANTPQDRTIAIKHKETITLPLKKSPSLITTTTPAELGTAEAINAAKNLAQNAQTLEELKAAIQNFDGLALKFTATNLVFADGNPKMADIMIIGEAPEADEDREGRPFIGESGQLLHKILQAANLPTEQLYLTNILNWRPPGNRPPTPQEVQISHPFISRHIELVQPKILVLLGNTATKTLLNTPKTITKLRGKWQNTTLANTNTSIPTLPTFHPKYLLKSPKHKRQTWQDILSLKAKANA